MKRYFILWVLVLCFLFGFCTEASTGSLEIKTNEKEEFSFTYMKVADYKNGKFILKEPFQESGINLNEIKKGDNLRKAAAIFSTYEEEKIRFRTKEQVAQIGPLSEGVYLIEGIPEDGYAIQPALISIPQWDTSDEEFSYHITVIPKIQSTDYSVDTSDSTNLLLLSVLCLLSLGVVVGVSGRAYFLKDR